jgi:hypothetical protein
VIWALPWARRAMSTMTACCCMMTLLVGYASPAELQPASVLACMQAYRAVRSAGENDIGSILLSIVSDLEAFNFDETFTGNFEVHYLSALAVMYMLTRSQLHAQKTVLIIKQVANKAVEMLMSKDGQEVCGCG